MSSSMSRKRRYKTYLFDDSQQVPYRTLCRNRDGSSAQPDYNEQPGTSTSQQPATSHFTLPVPNPYCDSDDNSTDSGKSNLNSNAEEENNSVEEGEHLSSLTNSSENEDDVLHFSEEESGEENDIQNEGSTSTEDFLKLPIYHDNPQTVGLFLTKLLEIYSKHKLTKSCLDDILKFVVDLIPKPHNIPTTKYKLFKIVQHLSTYFNPVIHNYCSTCTGYIALESNDQSVDGSYTPCSKCGSNERSSFVTIPVNNCIKNLFENCQLFKKLINQEEPINMCDILTSFYYKDLKTKICPSKYDVTININSDGVSLSKSSSLQLWPIQATINELPPHIRSNYIIVIGLWLGTSKPNMNTFFRPLSEELDQNSEFFWKHPESKKEICSKIAISFITVDAPARAMIQNISQFNGKYGCNFCEQNGKVVAKGSGHCRVYSLLESPPALRQKERMLEQAEADLDSDQRFGVKGHSVLSIIQYFNIATAFIPDYMHCVLLGVTRQFLNVWFDSSNSNKDFYIPPRVRRRINKELEEIKPPDVIIRIPRSIDNRSSWKASELRSWLLYYSTPTLSGKIPNRYFQHWLLLVKSIYLLLQENVIEEEINLAEVLLKLFISEVEDLYGEQECSYNVHQLSHLADSVRNWGPLWATSCFPYESNNGFLSKSIHGTHQVQSELVNTLKIANLLQVLKCRSREESLSISTAVVEPRKFEPIGKPAESSFSVPDVVKTALELVEGQFTANSVHVFFRVKLSDEIYTSKSYLREMKHNSYTVGFKVGNTMRFGEIQYYVLVNNNNLYAVVTTYTTEDCFYHKDTSVPISHIKETSEFQNNVPINVNCIQYKVVRLCKYICCRPNFIERNL